MMSIKKSVPFALSAMALSVSQCAWATPPTSGAYIDDQAHRNSWVQDQVGDEISTVNMIMCVMSGLRGDAMVNQGAYVALIDMNKCQSRGKGGSSAGDSAGAANATDYMSAVVQSTQASTSDPLIIKAWMTEEEEGQKKTIYAYIVATAGKSETNPNGLFSMYFCGKPQGSTLSDPCVFKGALKADDTGLSFYQLEDGTPRNMTLSSSGASGSGRLQGTDHQSNPVNFTFAYNGTHFLRSNGVASKCFDRSEANAETSTWRYGTYNADGSRMEASHPGFPVKYVVTTPEAKTYYGYWGFWGLWLPQSAMDTFGTSDEGVLTRQVNGAPQALTVVKKGGKLWKLTRKSATLDDFKGGSMMFWAPSTISAASVTLSAGTNYELQWDGANQVLNVIGAQDCTTTPGRCDTVPMGPFALHASDFPANAKALSVFFPAAGGNGALVLPSSGDFAGATEVSYRTREVVSPSTTLQLDCLTQCPKSGSDLTAGFAASPKSPFVGNWGPVVAPAASYTYTGGSFTDDGNSNAAVDASGFAKETMGSYQWGLTSGTMISHANVADIACNAGGGLTGTLDHLCPGLIDQVAETYQWETGPNAWNQYVGASAGGNPVTIDPPKDLSFAVTSNNIRASDVSKFSGSTMRLQFNGFGELQGIPGHCVKQLDNSETTNCDQNTRWVPAFDIVDGSFLTEASTPYYVQYLEREQRFANVNLSFCSALTLPSSGTTLDLSSIYTVQPDVALEGEEHMPTPANPKAAVIDGTVQ